MDIDNDRIEYAARHTEILRHPQQHLSTFGVTNVYYYLVTEPIYSELVHDINETVIREGRVIAEKPKIVTPYYLSRLEGFSSDARRYFDMLIKMHGADTPGLYYTYKNEPKGLNIVSDNWPVVVDRLKDEIEKKGDPLAAIIKGQDDLWDVSLLKFIYEITRNSLQSNISQLGARGLFNTDARGIPIGAKLRLEELFGQVARGECNAYELERELNRWGVFEDYQDRFFSVIRGRK
jgi:hypothetical protein